MKKSLKIALAALGATATVGAVVPAAVILSGRSSAASQPATPAPVVNEASANVGTENDPLLSGKIVEIPQGSDVAAFRAGIDIERPAGYGVWVFWLNAKVIGALGQSDEGYDAASH